MQHATHPYCKVCSLVVAPQDPEKVQKGIDVYHYACLRKQEKKQDIENRRLRTLRARYA